MRGVSRSAAERARLIAAWRASGLSTTAFARRRGIPPSTVYQWLAADVRARQPIRIAQVVRRAPPADSAVAVAPALVVELGGARIRVSAGFDRSVLAAVLDVLEPRVGNNPS